jgi:hypothetical protein
MRRLLFSVVALLFPLAASGTPTTFDFTTLNAGANNTALANSETVAGVLAEGFVTDVGVFSSFTAEPLWLRNEPNDHGLGVCSEGTSSCQTSGGDVNELSNQNQSEAIRLTLPVGATWVQLWISSLDDGGTSNNESAILYWSNTPTGFTAANSFAFDYNAISPAVETQGLLGLPAASSFDVSARYVLFVNNPANGSNNDYLVWGGQYQAPLSQIPEPGILGLLGIALLAMGFPALRRRIA